MILAPGAECLIQLLYFLFFMWYNSRHTKKKGGRMMTVTIVYYDFGKKETVRETREIDD